MKVIAIDNNTEYLELYPNLFKDFEGYEFLGCFSSVNDALVNFKSINPDIIISEIELPDDISGIHGINSFRKINANVKIIIVSSFTGINHIRDAFSNRVNGYISKPFKSTLLLQALNSVSKEEIKVSNLILQKIISAFLKKKYPIFSDRENEIIDLLSQGYTYKTIASELFITPSTVNFHIQNIYAKLDVNSKSMALAKLKKL